MKVIRNGLKQYIDFNWSPEELTGVWLRQVSISGLRAVQRESMVVP